jgi:hypothetical protein
VGKIIDVGSGEEDIEVEVGREEGASDGITEGEGIEAEVGRDEGESDDTAEGLHDGRLVAGAIVVVGAGVAQGIHQFETSQVIRLDW